MPRERRSAAESFSVPAHDRFRLSSKSLTVTGRRATTKTAFNPSNLVSHCVANYPAGIEIRISLPLNAVTFFAHSADRRGGSSNDDGGTAVAADDENGTEGRTLPRIISFEVLADERIVLPVRLYGLLG